MGEGAEVTVGDIAKHAFGMTGMHARRIRWGIWIFSVRILHSMVVQVGDREGGESNKKKIR